MKNPLSKIARLKRKARSEYFKATSYQTYMDCGRGMAKIIRPDIQTHEDNYDRLADELKQLGEPIPDFRFTGTGRSD